MDNNASEIDVEFLEQDAEERLTQSDAVLLGLAQAIEKPDFGLDSREVLYQTLY